MIFARSLLKLAATAAMLLGVAPTLFADRADLHPDATAVAYLKPANGSDVTGTIQFIPSGRGVRILAHVMNLSPGKHGFHVHEHGDLSAPDLASAGGHFNPTKAPHAGPDARRRHVGDLGNLTAGQDGVATLDRVDYHLQLDGENSVIDRAVIVHAKPDDFKSQPSGNSGDRVAGGVIQRVRR